MKAPKYIPMLKVIVDKDKIDFEPIDSIPIEWIINHPKYPKNEDKAKVIEDMIEDWKKENGYVSD